MNEAQQKILILREFIRQQGLGGIVLRGTDWFSWATAGGSNVVLQASSTGVAEVLVSQHDAFVLTDTIESQRLRSDEVPAAFEVWEHPWENHGAKLEFIQEVAGGKPIGTDIPSAPGEASLPYELILAKRQMSPSEIERYTSLGIDASRAMTEVLRVSKPDWTEFDLAAHGSAALWARGIQPALVMAAGYNRMQLHRHPMPTMNRLGDAAMLVFCARRHGLFANLTRFVYFRRPTDQEQDYKHAVAQVERAAWSFSHPSANLRDVLFGIIEAYAKVGFPHEHERHHQGGLTGYQAREEVATPSSDSTLRDGNALAWNPSLPGAKMEDTILCTMNGNINLTDDPGWPKFSVEGVLRPDFMVKA
jgi:Xaa-Pro aminopeptidase